MFRLRSAQGGEAGRRFVSRPHGPEFQSVITTVCSLVRHARHHAAADADIGKVAVGKGAQLIICARISARAAPADGEGRECISDLRNQLGCAVRWNRYVSHVHLSFVSQGRVVLSLLPR